MALNINFSGNVYRHDGTIGNNDIYYRVYFRKVNASSSNSQWDTYKSVEGQTRKCESTGFFSFNLGDAGILTQDGVVNDNDEVIVTFFIDENDSSNDDKDSCSLTEIGSYKWILTGASVYTKDMQLISTDENINPDVKPSLSEWRLNNTGPGGSSDGRVYTLYNYSSANCAPVSKTEYTTTKGGTMYHWWKEGSEIINDGFRITKREYDFDDGLGFQTLSDIGQYQWTTAGVRHNKLRLTTCFGNTNESVIGSTDIVLRVFWRQPVPDISCLQAVSGHIQIPDTVVTFQYNGTDPDDKISTIDWFIEDGSYDTNSTGHSKGDTISHTNGPGTSWFGHSASSGAFGNPGIHNISIIIHWDNGIDGTNTPTISFDKDFIQDVFSGPSLDFFQDPVLANIDQPLDATNTSTNISRVGTGGSGEEYDWEFDDDGHVSSVLNKPYSYVYTIIPTTINSKITLYAHWNNGFEDKLSSVTKNVIFSTRVDIIEGYYEDASCVYAFFISGSSTGGGNPTGYRWEVYYDPDGINELIWTSPTNLDQQYKRFYFPKIGKYRIVGFVSGAGSETTAHKDIDITKVCTGGGEGGETIILGGAAPPYFKQESQRIVPTIRVVKMTMENIFDYEKIAEKINVKLIDNTNTKNK